MKKKVTFLLDSPYKWGKGWTASREAKESFNDNTKEILNELDFNISVSDFGVIEGNKTNKDEAYMHPMEFVFRVEDDFVDVVEQVVKTYEKNFYIVTKVLIREID